MEGYWRSDSITIQDADGKDFVEIIDIIKAGSLRKEQKEPKGGDRRPEVKSTKKYDDHEDLKGDQDELPDELQKAIIKKAGGDPEEEEKEKVKEAAGMSGNPKEDALRQIVADKQMGKVDGTTVDMTSANVILQVLDALNPQNREKYLNLPVKDMADIAFKMMK